MTDKQFSLDEMQADIEAVFSLCTKDIIEVGTRLHNRLKEIEEKAKEQEASKYVAFNAILKARYEQFEKDIAKAASSLS